MVENGPNFFLTDSNDIKWSKIVQNGTKWSKMYQHVPKPFKMVQYYPEWFIPGQKRSHNSKMIQNYIIHPKIVFACRFLTQTATTSKQYNFYIKCGCNSESYD